MGPSEAATALRPIHPGRTALLMLLAIDAVYMLADLVCNIMGLKPISLFQLHRDRSLPEYYQYMKLAWAMLHLVLLGWSVRSWRPLVWLPLFALLLLSDAFQLHEQFGWRLAAATSIPGDWGEIVVVGGLAATSALLLLASWPGSPSWIKRFHLRVVLLLGLLSLFGIVADLLVASATNGTREVWARVEDGGEMLATSCLLAFLVACLADGLGRRNRAAQPSVGAALPA